MYSIDRIMHRFKNSAVRTACVSLASFALLSSAACLDDPADPFVVTGDGAVEGQLFLDRDRSGVFDPSSGDELLAGVGLEVRNRGTGEAVASGSTGSEGRFSFASLPPGTLDLWVNESTLPTGALVCRNPTPVSIYRFETQSVSLAAEPVCLIQIQEAKDAGVGTFVNVQGIVTAAGNDIRNDYTYVQDGSTGIRIFSSSFAGSVERGQRVTLTGTVGDFNDDLQISSPTLVQTEDGFQVPVPRTVETGEIQAAGPIPTDPLQGRLVMVQRAELTRGFTSGGDRNALIDDGSGVVELRVESGVSGESGDAILAVLGMTVGNCYDITGLVGNFRGTAQLFPRDANDVTEVACAAGGEE